MKGWLCLEGGIVVAACLCGVLCRANASDTGLLDCHSISDTHTLPYSFVATPAQCTSFGSTAEERIARMTTSDAMARELGWKKEIFTVRVEDSAEILYDTVVYHATVTSVVQGDTAQDGDRIALYQVGAFQLETKQAYQRRFEKDRVAVGEAAVQPRYQQYASSFNLMQAENEYLVAVSSLRIGNADYYQVTPSLYWNLSSDASAIVDDSVPFHYAMYADNEIFTCSQSFLDDFLAVKHAVLESLGFRNRVWEVSKAP